MENIMASSYGHKPVLAPIKVFTCKYCGRKFLNSRALGGHQNAHKKERTIWMTGMSNRKSIGLETHSLFRNPVQEDSRRKQKFNEVGDQDSCWSGSFHVYSSDSNVPDNDTVTASNPGKRVMAASNYGDLVPDESDMDDLDLDLHL